MPKWPLEKKFAAIFVVCIGHVAVLTAIGHSSASGKTSKTVGKFQEKPTIVLQQRLLNVFPATPQPSPVPARQVHQHAGPSDSPKQNEPAELTKKENRLDTKSRFLSSEEVAQSAEPSDEFEALLEQVIPADVKTLALEFWIDRDGQTTEVKCIEGDCTNDILVSLPKLNTLIFVPARNNGKAVASRKIIRIDSQPVVDF